MGVPGLWEIINKAGKSRSFTHLTVVDGFEANKSGKRAYRVGIDASIWYNHASFMNRDGQDRGENADLRTLFFRLAERPKVKRGSKMGKAGSHGLTDSFKKVLDGFGMEWRMALGEAEAELAHLNRIGVLDAIMTDDVDTLLFGAQTIIKNPSMRLSGNKANPALNSEGKASKYHVMVYRAEDIRSHPEIGLTKGGMILIALLAGGDYDKGVERCGKEIAHGLARCGFGDQLLTLYDRRTREDIRPFLASWRTAVNQELRSNSRGFLRHKCPSLSIPATFPNMEVLEFYMNPVCSGRVGRQGGGPIKGTDELNLSKLAAICEEKFGEWGYMRAIIKRFRTVLWQAAVMRVLRRAALEADERERDKRLAEGQQGWAAIGPLRPSTADAVGTPASLVKRYVGMTDEDRRRTAFANNRPGVRDAYENDPNPLVVKITKSRHHTSTDHLLEYCVAICPIQLVVITRSGIKGIRPEPANATAILSVDDDLDDLRDGPPKASKGPKKPIPLPDSNMSLWLPASILRHVHPGLVEEFEAAEAAKDRKATKKGKGKEKATAHGYGSDAGVPSSPPKPPPKQKRQPKAKYAQDADVVPPTGQLVPMTAPILDPWFTADYQLAGPSGSSSVATLSAYFLYSQNPDNPSFLVDAVDDAPSEDDDVPVDDGPRDRFDDMFDQIMGFSKKAPRPRKAATSSGRCKRPISAVDGDGAIGTRQERTAKRTKAANTSGARSEPAPVHPSRSCKASTKITSGLIDLDSDDNDDPPFRSQFTASSRTPPTSPPPMRNRQVTTSRKRHFQVPSSPHSGRDFLADAEMIIDLT